MPTENDDLPAPLDEAAGVTVCGGQLRNADGCPSAMYRGRRVYFCTLACQRAFEVDPDRFMAGEIKHPTGDD